MAHEELIRVPQELMMCKRDGIRCFYMRDNDTCKKDGAVDKKCHKIIFLTPEQVDQHLPTIIKWRLTSN
jgi:hypothetical protein